MSVEFVYFDLDDTLLDHGHAERNALADVRERYLEIFGTLSVDDLQARYQAINGPLWRRYANGEVDKSTLQEERFEQLLEAVGAGQAESSLVRRYYMQRYATHWTFIPGAREAFETVADRVPVGIMTNGFADVQAKKLEAFPVLEDRADAIVICEETGVLKPHPRVFAHATAEAGVEADDVLYVGDSYRSDIEGGQKAGWRVAWFAPDDGERGLSTNGRAPVERGFSFQDWTVLCERIE